MKVEIETTAKERAKAIIDGKAELIAELATELQSVEARRQGIIEALIDLGEKRKRRKVAEPKKRGRPAGSRNVAKSAPLIDGPNAAAGENL